MLVGLSRIYLRAHYASDVLAGEALAVAMYALAAIGTVTRLARHRSARPHRRDPLGDAGSGMDSGMPPTGFEPVPPP